MNAAMKIILGLLMLGVGIWMMADPAWFGCGTNWMCGLGYWTQTWNIIKGSIGPMLVLIGIFVVWLESEELKSK